MPIDFSKAFDTMLRVKKKEKKKKGCILSFVFKKMTTKR